MPAVSPGGNKCSLHIYIYTHELTVFYHAMQLFFVKSTLDDTKNHLSD